jgi:hypothetical protein
MDLLQTKNMAQVDSVSALSSDQKLLVKDTNGKINALTPDGLKTELLGAMDIDKVMSGIFIMAHSGGTPQAYLCSEWTAKQNSGMTADGVLIIEGGRHLVVAPTGTTLPWSSAAVNGGGVMTTDRLTALNDWEGKANTAAQIEKEVCQGTSYAPGYCAAYARTNSSGYGLTAGKWWLPSLGELWMICAHRVRINYALSLISGATQIGTGWHWSSTEFNSYYKWNLNMGDQSVNYYGCTYTGQVRPVSAFIS